MADGKYSSRELTEFLRKVAQEPCSITDDGDTISNAEHLARVIWKKAQGYTEVVHRGAESVEKVHPAASWAIQLLVERLDGKVATTVEKDENRISAADRVSELATKIVNEMALVHAPSQPGPPPLPRKDSDSDGE